MNQGRGTAKKAKDNSQSAELETLNFKVPNSFKRAYKVYAAQHGMTMLELLKEGFELSKQGREASR